MFHLLSGSLANPFENVGAIIESAHGETVCVTLNAAVESF